jgi:hypothetical protein
VIGATDERASNLVIRDVAGVTILGSLMMRPIKQRKRQTTPMPFGYIALQSLQLTDLINWRFVPDQSPAEHILLAS